MYGFAYAETQRDTLYEFKRNRGAVRCPAKLMGENSFMTLYHYSEKYKRFDWLREGE